MLMQCELLQSLTAAAAAASPVASDHQQGSSSSAPLTAAEGGEERIAPRCQSLAYLEYVITAPVFEEARTVTPQQVAATYKDCVSKASLLLHRLDSEPLPYGPTRQDTINELANCWDRHFRMMISAIIVGRPELIAAFTVYDFSTLQPAPEGYAATSANITAMAPLLHLSPLQMQDVSSGLAVFTRLLQQVKEQQQQAHVESSSSGSNTGAAAPEVATFESVMSNIEATAQSMGRMETVLRKEYTVRASAAGWIIGCLSWQQITRAAVLAWPHAVHTLGLAHSIADYYKQQPRLQPSP